MLKEWISLQTSENKEEFTTRAPYKTEVQVNKLVK